MSENDADYTISDVPTPGWTGVRGNERFLKDLLTSVPYPQGLTTVEISRLEVRRVSRKIRQGDRQWQAKRRGLR